MIITISIEKVTKIGVSPKAPTKEKRHMEQNSDFPYDGTPEEKDDDFLGNLFWENRLPWDPKAVPEDMKDDFYDDVESEGPEWWETENMGD